MYELSDCKVGYCFKKETIASSAGYFQFKTTAISMTSFKASPFVRILGRTKSML